MSCVSLRVNIWELYTELPTYRGRIRCSVIAEEFTYAGRSEPCLVLGLLRAIKNATPMTTADMPAVNGKVIARVSRTASGLMPAIGTFSTD